MAREELIFKNEAYAIMGRALRSIATRGGGFLKRSIRSASRSNLNTAIFLQKRNSHCY